MRLYFKNNEKFLALYMLASKEDLINFFIIELFEGNYFNHLYNNSSIFIITDNPNYFEK